MILDLQKFIDEERPYWAELETELNRLESEPGLTLGLDRLKRFHYLYERTLADLGKIASLASAPELRRYLESLAARAYGEIHETREQRQRFSPGRWLTRSVPETFRRHYRTFALSVAVTIVGCLFGGLALWLDPQAKSVIMPFSHLMQHPSERVAQEENQEGDRLAGRQGTFSARLMTHNTKVAMTAMALGMTYGLGTLILLFYNGVILGAVAIDYILAGETVFLLGWLLPHGSIEIPAILIAGQAGLMLAGGLIGWGSRQPLRQRFRALGPDLVTLLFAVALMLVWAGLVESFLSQYHEPQVPYPAKIAFGLVELGFLAIWLGFGGRSTSRA